MQGPGEMAHEDRPAHGPLSRLRRWWACPHCRSWRVIALLGAISLMSLGDYLMTVEHLRGPGLVEGNPIARFIVNHGSGISLALYKFGTVGLAIGILYAYRRQRLAEGASFVAFAVLVALCVQWMVYSDELSALAEETTWNGHLGDPRLVMLNEPAD